MRAKTLGLLIICRIDMELGKTLRPSGKGTGGGNELSNRIHSRISNWIFNRRYMYVAIIRRRGIKKTPDGGIPFNLVVRTGDQP